MVLLVSLFMQLAQAQLSSRFEVYGSVNQNQILKSSLINPQNTVFQLPNQSQILELRPDLQWQFSEPLSLVIRSRHWLQIHDEQSLSDLTDLFFNSQFSNQTSFAVGLQNYQWGPAEILSPSNVFYHFKSDQRSFDFKEKGRVLARINYSIDEKTQAIIIYEPIDNRTQNWVAEVDFHPQSAIKIERQLETPVDSIAFIIGNSGPKGKYLSTHLNYSIQETYSFYADAKIERDGQYYTPQFNELVLSTDSDRSLAVLGFRFEGEFDFRQEFIWNEAGLSGSGWKKMILALSIFNPNFVSNLDRFSRSGLELPSNSYSYSSIRFPDFGQRKQFHASTRWLRSFVQDSSALQLNLEHDWNDWVVVSSEVLLPFGKKNTEFLLLQGQQISLGFKATF